MNMASGLYRLQEPWQRDQPTIVAFKKVMNVASDTANRDRVLFLAFAAIKLAMVSYLTAIPVTRLLSGRRVDRFNPHIGFRDWHA
jgi:hypothetical protein